MSSLVYKVVKGIKSDGFRKLLLKPLFRKNHLHLDYFKSVDDKFFIYGVDKKYFPSEKLNWYMHFGMLRSTCEDICQFHYKVKEGDTIIDIGAGLGEEAIVLSEKVGSTGKIYSIEANPRVYQILKKVVELNKCSNVEVLNLAINREDADITIVDDDDSYKTGFVGEKKNENLVKVPGLRLDSFIKKFRIERIDLLKCNIEGAERFLVDSIDESFLPRIRNVAIACHDFRYSENQNDFFVTKEYIMNYLKRNSFEIVTRNSGIDYKDDWVYGRNLKAAQ